MTEPHVPPPPETAGQPVKWSNPGFVDRALKEGEWWSDLGKLRQKANAGMLRAYGFIAVGLFTLVSLLLAIGIVSYAAEMLTPWGWLSATQVDRIEAFLSSGFVGAIIGWIAKRHFDHDKTA